jgi:hypothetical protein
VAMMIIFLNDTKSQTKTTKTLFLKLVTTFGIKKNEHATRLIQNEITMDALF